MLVLWNKTKIIKTRVTLFARVKLAQAKGSSTKMKEKNQRYTTEHFSEERDSRYFPSTSQIKKEREKKIRGHKKSGRGLMVEHIQSIEWHKWFFCDIMGKRKDRDGRTSIVRLSEEISVGTWLSTRPRSPSASTTDCDSTILSSPIQYRNAKFSRSKCWYPNKSHMFTSSSHHYSYIGTIQSVSPSTAPVPRKIV